MRFRLMITMVIGLLGCGDDGASGARDAGGTRDAEDDVDSGELPDTGAPAETLRWEMITPPETGPLGRWGYVVARLGGQRAILIGGATFDAAGGGTVVRDAWIFDAADGTAPVLTEVTVDPAFQARYCGCAAYDPVRDVVLISGGRDGALATLTETWELALATETWTEITTPGPTAGVGCSLAWSPDADAFFLFGGGGKGGFSAETWRYDVAAHAWTQLAITGPSERYDASLRHVRDGAPLVLFAGARGAMAGPGFHSDVWLLHVEGEPRWEQLATTGGPPPGRRVPWQVTDDDGHGLIAGMGVGGLQPAEAIADLWHLDLDTGTWTALDPGPDGPSPRGFAQALPGGPGAVGILLGGTDNADPKREIWRLRRE